MSKAYFLSTKWLRFPKYTESSIAPMAFLIEYSEISFCLRCWRILIFPQRLILIFPETYASAKRSSLRKLLVIRSASRRLDLLDQDPMFASFYLTRRTTLLISTECFQLCFRLKKGVFTLRLHVRA